MSPKDRLVADIVEQVLSWARDAAADLADPEADPDLQRYKRIREEFEHVRSILSTSDATPDQVEAILSSTIAGLAHSILVIMDNWANTPEYFVKVLDQQGNEFQGDLHEHFISKWMDANPYISTPPPTQSRPQSRKLSPEQLQRKLDSLKRPPRRPKDDDHRQK